MTDFTPGTATDEGISAATQTPPRVSSPQSTVIGAAQPAPQPYVPMPVRTQEAYRVALGMYRQDPNWVTFFREVLGVEGVARKLFQTAEEMNEFEQTEEYAQVQQMLTKLRERTKAQAEQLEPTRVITVRLPKSLHESLRAEAHSQETSMNKLCISKLLQVIARDLIPEE